MELVVTLLLSTVNDKVPLSNLLLIVNSFFVNVNIFLDMSKCKNIFNRFEFLAKLNFFNLIINFHD